MNRKCRITYRYLSANGCLFQAFSLLGIGVRLPLGRCPKAEM